MSEHDNNSDEPTTTTEPTTTEPAAEALEQPAGRREAKYRRELRETEAERDALRERVETLQRAEAERLASQALAKPAALWASGVSLTDLLDDAGNLDHDKVTQAAAAAADQLGAARSNTPKPDLTQGGTGEYAGRPRDQWAEAFAPSR